MNVLERVGLEGMGMSWVNGRKGVIGSVKTNICSSINVMLALR